MDNAPAVNPDVPNKLPDLTTKVNSSVSGFVNNENNEALKGAVVKIGTATTFTNSYGYFEIKNIQVVKEAATVTIIHEGYFKAIKTYMAEEGKAAFFRIKLLPKIITGTINANAGGNASLSNGLNISFPADGIKNATTGNTYSGNVNIAVQYIDPTSTELNSIMPGDLRGTNTDGYIKALESYGMIAVELTGDYGQLLQIADGKKATISAPVPSSLLSNAPATIPLWYFDETNGLWKEEGVATKTGNAYVGDVSHFSFWNFDNPIDFIQFNCTVLNAAGTPVPFALVKLSMVTDPTIHTYGWTDASGYVAGPVPANAQLQLDIYSDYNCSTALFTQTFSTTNTNLAFGNINVTNTANNIATVSCNITDCNMAPVTNGYLLMIKNNQYTRYPANGSGGVQFPAFMCNGSQPVTFVAENPDAAQQSNPLNYTLTTGTNAIGNLATCSLSNELFIHVNTDGFDTVYIGGVDTFDLGGIITQWPPSYYVAGALSVTGINYHTVQFGFADAGIATGSTQLLREYYDTDHMRYPVSPIYVHITEYGDVGEYIAGYFSGVMAETDGGSVVHTYNVSFRIRHDP
ncbi:MAG: hypothetical protein QM737_04655 [Ferruginibacter sp.]